MVLVFVFRWTDARFVRVGEEEILHHVPIAGDVDVVTIVDTRVLDVGRRACAVGLEYTALVWGVILDWALWRTLPGPLTFVGAAVIIASARSCAPRWKVARLCSSMKLPTTAPNTATGRMAPSARSAR